MVLDFAGVPPEITSGLMYAGAGAGPLMAAAAAYNNLAAELTSTATQWESIISLLTTEQWTGAGSAAAAAAAQPIVSWLTTSAAALEQAGAQATASAAAYEAAFAATVPPPVIAANRTLLATLVATNFLGVNSAAIAATEAQYAEMWVQDATMMATYQAASAAAGVLQPVAPMTPATNPAGGALQAASVTQASTSAPVQALTNTVSSAAPALSLSSLSSSSLVSSIDGFLGTPAVFNAINGGVNTAAWFTMNTIPTAVSLGHTLGAVPSIPFALTDSVAPVAGGAIMPGTMVGSVSGAAASASLGEASAVGGLSVPAGWNAASGASLASSTAPLEGSGWTVAAEEPVAAMPGMPGMAAAAKGAGAYGAGPRYGFKPIVMPKQVVV
ncbi:PPE family protein [Mycobacterium avium]|uniref:PPE family protein n=3 Tax=Mycobacterium avium TaxID=1764 RepID=A0A2A3L4S6_MYCAV|nr:PPE family protein [Mycobacterium avium]ATO67763.1 PPE family protein [Mycobacterium avium subsp. hominissuis]PBJ31708.1 PPE family protein [Mycobacterium avium subsp. hominissuis]PBJ42367.1 PPE family protein [Mycobacterium avium subsp. hominissuis]QXD08187.1 PPE family protein [Mycobacterium avium subsp. hominissuis]